MKTTLLKSILTLVCVALSQVSFAQIQFERVLPPPTVPLNSVQFNGVSHGSLAFADVNGNGHQEVLVTGRNTRGTLISKLYANDGEGNFSEVSGTPFDGVNQGSIAFADIDGDGDQDVLITGLNNSNTRIAKLFTNDGEGNFTEVNNTPFEGVSQGSIAFADIDGDGDQDILVTGLNNSNTRIAKLYTNDGEGNFTEVNDNAFDGVNFSSIAFSDVNGDDYLDVLITGQNSSGDRIAQLYINDGEGNFALVNDTPFDGVFESSIAFADIDGDGDQDLLITGLSNSNVQIAKLYINDGKGRFTEVEDTPFEGVNQSAIAFADVNSDGTLDVVLAGKSLQGNAIAKLYTNDGTGDFTEVTDSPFEGVSYSAIGFADVDGDGHLDVLITGQNNSNARLADLYINDGKGDFMPINHNFPFQGVFRSSIAFADVNGDGNQDVLITGISRLGRIAKLYLNDGEGNFSEVLNTPFEGVAEEGSAAFADVNGNGYQDVLITGQNDFNRRSTKLYLNDGEGNFTEASDTPFEAMFQSALAFADVNGNGHQDVLISGIRNHPGGGGLDIFPKAILYLNRGDGTFREASNSPFQGLALGSVAFADVDGDGDLDVLITGTRRYQAVDGRANLYLNNGVGHFTKAEDSPFAGVTYGSGVFADVDNDGHQDALISGFSTYRYQPQLYMNDGSGNFTRVSETPFENRNYYRFAFADVDQDGDQDLLMIGRSIAKLYTNDGKGNFTELDSIPFEELEVSSIAFADVNNDGYPDVLVTGIGSERPVTNLYLNTTCMPNRTINTTTISACGHFYWEVNGKTYTKSGTYRFVNGCHTEELVLDITGLQQDDIIVEGSTLSVDIDNASFQWFDCNNDFSVIEGATSAIFTPQESGNYAVLVKDNECSVLSECIDVIVLSLDLASDILLKVYPNPTQSVLHLSVPESLNGETVRLMNSTGQLVKSQSIDATEIEIEMSDLTSGLYFIQLSSEKGMVSKRIIKN